MGYNISGLVIDKNYQNDLNQLEEILGEKLNFEKGVPFEEGSENWKDDNYCDIYFSETGTLIFISMERAAFEFKIKQQKAFSFALSEMTMTFAVNYTDNTEIIRSFAETEDGTRHQEVGKKLPFEENESDVSELIYHLIEKTLGKTFWSIDLEEKCFRYKFESQSIGNTSMNENKISTSTISISQEKKPWWKFW